MNKKGKSKNSTLNNENNIVKCEDIEILKAGIIEAIEQQKDIPEDVKNKITKRIGIELSRIEYSELLLGPLPSPKNIEGI